MISLITPLVIATHGTLEIFTPLENVEAETLRQRYLEACPKICPMVIRRSGKIVHMDKKTWQKIMQARRLN